MCFFFCDCYSLPSVVADLGGFRIVAVDFCGGSHGDSWW